MWIKQVCVLIGKKYLFINRSVLSILFAKCVTFSYYIFYRYVDKGIFELIGPFGLVNAIRSILVAQFKMHTGLIYHYAGYILLTLILLTHLVCDIVSNM
jgi:hypothetical protein